MTVSSIATLTVAATAVFLSSYNACAHVCDPEGCANPCTESAIATGEFYHPYCKSEDKYVQCDKFDGCRIMPCAPGSKWSQTESTCVNKEKKKKISKEKKKKFSTPWSQVGQKVMRSDVLAKHTIVGTSAQLYSAFGSDVTISSDGTRMAAVDRYGDKVTVYEYDHQGDDTGSWMELGQAIRSKEDNLAFESYGGEGGEYSEALAAAVISGDGQRVAVTSPYHSTDDIARSGRVRVYEYDSDGAWTQVGNDILGGYEFAYLGRALTVDLSEDGSILAVGDYRRNSYTGCVSIYTLNSNLWTLLGKEICGKEEWDRMGGSVSLSSKGNTIAVGVQGDNLDAGRAAVFRYSESGWIQAGSSILPDPGHCRLGWPVSLSADGTRVAVSGSSYLGKVSDCYYDDLAFEADDAGEVRVWELRNTNGGDDWTPLGSALTGSDSTDGLGWSVSLSGDGTTVAMGASNSDRGGGYDRGYARAYWYDDEEGTWAQVGIDIVGAKERDWTGHAVSLSYDGKRLAVSSPNDYGIAEEESGVVTVYEHEFVFAQGF